jgi:hypothetical protein
MRTIILACILIPFTLTAQQEMEHSLDTAYQNAKKGIYWALTNIPENKSQLRTDLITGDRLYSSVKLKKEYNGIRIESRGYNGSTEVTIILFRSTEVLMKEGYLIPSGGGEEKKE